MKKIVLIEDRYKRQELFTQELNFEFEPYADILDNFILDDFYTLANEIIHGSFSLSKYDIIICHESVQLEENKESNSIIKSNLEQYCKKNQKTLIFFSGGISTNFYDNSEFELLKLNSKTFYSKNLLLYLDAIREGNEDILMLCYGEHWKQNIVANVLEKTNIFLYDIQNHGVNPSDFEIDGNLSKVNYDFYKIQKKSLKEIEKFKESLESYFFYQNTKNTKNSSLLIHHDNICTFELFDEIEKFNANEDIDKYVNEMIVELKEKDFEMLFIKDNLSSNYLELLGLRVAYHVRLSLELGDKRFIPIVIVSDFSVEQLSRFDEMSNLLLTSNVYLCKNTKEDIQKFQQLELHDLTLEEYRQDFVSKIKVSPPKDYLSHHSIANEWAINRWAEFLKVETDATKSNKAKIRNMLYFKYLKAKYTTQDSINFKIKKPSKKGKVLLIDDEWDKGWSDILNAALQGECLEFETFEYDYKDKKAFNLIVQLDYKNLKEQVRAADVIILDLRLTQSDHDDDDIDSYSGVKILQKIHEVNAGIQVIMLTATSKSTTLEKLYEKKILGYIKKEHPDDTSVDTVENINKLVGLVDKGLERKFLKEIFIIQKDLLELELFKNLKFSFEMDYSTKKLFELKNTIERVFSTLDSNIPKPFVYGMSILYKCIETINDYYIYEQYDSGTKRQKAYWIYNNEPIDNNANASVNNKIKSLAKYLQVQNDELERKIDEISCTRNFEMHSGEIKKNSKDSLVRNITDEHIVRWFEMIKKIVFAMK